VYVLILLQDKENKHVFFLYLPTNLFHYINNIENSSMLTNNVQMHVQFEYINVDNNHFHFQLVYIL